jgi:hypothetical protein
MSFHLWRRRRTWWYTLKIYYNEETKKEIIVIRLLETSCIVLVHLIFYDKKILYAVFSIYEWMNEWVLYVNEWMVYVPLCTKPHIFTNI